MTIAVRPAVLADASDIAQVHVRAWQEAYGHLVPEESLARQSVDQRAMRWAEIISEQTENVWVAVDEALVVVGWASTSSGRGESPPRPLELDGLYILASQYGSGAGQLLFDAAIADAAAYLWVADDNPRARAFYTRNGFLPDGASDTHFLAGTAVRAIRLVR
ncbi:MAG TPA: GNAT family N-acetyltransferase [Galbitalea sp.]|jgi:L-amino acid N-acyltransferase YncA|nr:GNAT family N-acetyltransferase [Galbitalea sp.]